jgi:hypothetical protein
MSREQARASGEEIKSGEKVRTTETLPTTRTLTTDASEAFTACADLVIMLEVPTTSPTRSTLQEETMLETFLRKER